MAVLAGCARLTNNHGYVPEVEALDSIVVGTDTKDTVAQSVGRPGTLGLIDTRGWYYVRSEYERFLWRAPVETDHKVVVITFSDAEVVQNIETFGLENGQVVALNRRVTDSNTQGISFLRQLFSNFGRLNVGDLINEN
ncbi:MAG: outer membrane protein assembly factor BamE [Boseongicola sp.]|nr:MAG: outer membrane protein assembly factor BamE [Boseongicola sp.]